MILFAFHKIIIKHKTLNILGYFDSLCNELALSMLLERERGKKRDRNPDHHKYCSRFKLSLRNSRTKRLRFYK